VDAYNIRQMDSIGYNENQTAKDLMPTCQGLSIAEDSTSNTKENVSKEEKGIKIILTIV
jgi:hypothetical protein